MEFTYFCTGIVIFLIVLTVTGGLGGYIGTSSDGDWSIIAWGVSSCGLAVFLTEFLIHHGFI